PGNEMVGVVGMIGEGGEIARLLRLLAGPRQVVGARARRAGALAETGQQLGLFDPHVGIAGGQPGGLVEGRQGLLEGALRGEHLRVGELEGGAVGGRRLARGPWRSGGPRSRGYGRQEEEQGWNRPFHNAQNTSREGRFTSYRAPPIMALQRLTNVTTRS